MSQLTNYEKWHILNRDVISPQSFLDFSFYFMIGAALQRRVWIGNSNNPNTPGQLYPNPYIILVGPPSTGKGRAIIPTDSMLKNLRIDLNSGKIVDANPEEESIENYAFPCGPQNITYEQLVSRMAKSILRTNNQKANREQGEPAVYSHSSMFLCLEELSTLMQHDSQKVCQFLLQAYDCTDYRRETKTQGVSQIKKPSLSILAGTTPGYLEELFSEKLLDDGFASRFWFIYEMSPRFARWKSSLLTEDQIQAKVDLTEHLRKLWYVYGRVEFTEEADDYMSHWWSEELLGEQRINKSFKLNYYYGRKDNHVKKLATILNFSEQTDNFVVGIDGVVKACNILAEAEKRMHYALDYGGRNPIAHVAKKIEQYFLWIKKPLTGQELLEAFHSDLRELEMAECIRYMLNSGKMFKSGNKFYLSYLQHKIEGTEIIIPEQKQTSSGKRINGHDLKALPLDTDKKDINI